MKWFLWCQLRLALKLRPNMACKVVSMILAKVEVYEQIRLVCVVVSVGLSWPGGC